MQVLKYPHPVLFHKSKPLRRVDAELARWIEEMFELMYEHRGIGLAANQVGLPYRLMVVNLKSDPAEKDDEHVFINPVVVRRSGSAEAEEGCLSFPDVNAPVTRPERVQVTAFNLRGEQVDYNLGGLFARAVQHEVDHLDGILFIDRLSPAALLSIREELEQLQADYTAGRLRGTLPTDEEVAAELASLERVRT